MHPALDALEGAAGLDTRLWRAEAGALRLAHGSDPGWTPPLPTVAGPVATPDGERWLAPLGGADLWMESPAGPPREAAALHALLSLILRSDREGSYLSAELATRYEEIDLLYTISEVLGHSVRLEETAATIVRAVAEVVGAGRASLAVFDEESRTLRTVAARGFAVAEAPVVALDDPDSIAAQVVREIRPLVGIADVSPAPGDRGYRGEAYMSLPICFTPAGGSARCVGVINLTDRTNGGRFSAADQKLVAAAANQIGAAIELARLVVKEREQQRLRDELELAHDLQVLLLPEPNALRGDAQVAVRCLQADQVGGDFYTFNRLGLGVVAVMLGDVASHGFAAALVMAAVMAAAGIHASSGATPDVTLRALRDSLAERLAARDTYLTLFYCVLDPGRAELSWASAGHPYAFRIPAAGAPERLDATAPPLGLGERADIGLRTVPWAKGGDLLCLYTDGLVEAVNAGGERFGEERLLAALAARRANPPEQIVAEVMAEVTSFSPAAADDRTLLVLRL